MANVILKNINKVYPNKVQAVFDFNLEIKDKEFIVFVGPSGCGKSTTLRMVAGLEEITTGDLFIDGKYMNNVEPKDRNIAMVFQSYALYPHMTVFGNMDFALKLRKVHMPKYVNENEVSKDEINELKKKLAQIDKVFKKKQDDLSLLPEREKVLDELFAAVEARNKQLVQEEGIDTLTIGELKAVNKKLAKEIASNNKLAEKYSQKDPKGAEEVKILNESRQKQIDENNAEIARLEKTTVPLCVSRHLTAFERSLEVNRVAKSIDLIRYLYRKPSALSGGQRQRVALGRAIVRKPKVFLMDEPLSNLDAKLRVQTRGEITKIHKNVGATTIYVTHDQTEAMTMADRIVVMKDGWIQQIGTPEEIYENPANKFVGGFIGNPAMVFIKGIVKDGCFVAENDGSSMKISLPEKQVKILKNYEEKSIYLGTRPETIHLASEENLKNVSEQISCVCDFSELLGYERVIHTYICGSKITIKVPKEINVSANEKFDICFDMNKLYFFDGESEFRIK